MLGREGQAWLARLEAEGARLRWLTGQNPPTADVKRGSNVINFDLEAGPTEAPPPPKAKKGKK